MMWEDTPWTEPEPAANGDQAAVARLDHLGAVDHLGQPRRAHADFQRQAVGGGLGQFQGRYEVSGYTVHNFIFTEHGPTCNRTPPGRLRRQAAARTVNLARLPRQDAGLHGTGDERVVE